MSEETNAKTRKTAGPMDTAIVKIEGTTITVLKKFETPPTDKEVKAALAEIGEGTFTLMTSRSRAVGYKKVVAEKFDL
jgi:hypothetical protein